MASPDALSPFPSLLTTPAGDCFGRRRRRPPRLVANSSCERPLVTLASASGKTSASEVSGPVVSVSASMASSSFLALKRRLITPAFLRRRLPNDSFFVAVGEAAGFELSLQIGRAHV